MNALHNFLFIILPYIAIAVFFVGVIYRYRVTPFKYSSLSSQFLEGNKLFWGSVPFHFGMLVVFLGHLIAFLCPRHLLAWNSDPVRLITGNGLPRGGMFAKTTGKSTAKNPMGQWMWCK